MDVVCVVFVCTAANHMGLIYAVQSLAKIRRMPVISCIKCFTFWSVLAVLLFTGTDIIASLAISFAAAWSAVWLDLFMGLIDRLYINIYDSFYPTADATDADKAGADGAMPHLQKGKRRKHKAASKYN